jgi:spermidine synthase
VIEPLERSAAAATTPGPPLRTLATLFFFSGFPALVYQLVWQRALFRIFGVNVESVTVVVTAFMLGLGLGSLAGGALSRRRIPLLPLLAAIELLTAAFGLLSLRVFDAVARLVLGASLAVTAAATLALVIVPTLLMGATLPVLVAHLVRRTARVGSSVGLLYEANTLGAGAACVLAAVALFPFLGMQGSLDVAAGINAAVAAGAVAVHLRDRRRPRSAAAPPPPLAGPGPAPGAAAARLGPVLALAALGGMVSLSYELLFFRTISYATGSSASAFAVTLAAFLGGLAAGSRRAGRSCLEGEAPALRRAERALLAGSLLGWAFLPAAAHLAPLGWAALAAVLALVYLVARSFGVLLPTLAHLGVAPDADAGMGTALVYLANILGSATGTIVTGFVLMDRLRLVGIAAVLAAAGLACAALLAPLVAGRRRARPLRAAALAGAAAAAALALPPLTSGLLERLLWKATLPADARFARVVENRSGIITVDAAGTVFGHGMYDGRFNVDLVDDTNGIFRAYALALFHPEPRDVLMIGLSSGSWAQVIANHPSVATLTVVEINPGAADLVRGAPAVASVLSNPKVRVHVDDGRRWLRLNPDRRFDAIVSNTTYYFRAHATNLLSTEFLLLARAHLKPGGVLLYNTTGSERVQRTGCLAFPHGARLSNQLALSTAPLAVDAGRWRAALRAWRIDGRPVLDPEREEHARVLERLAGMAPEPCAGILERTAGRAPVTDDNMGSEWRFIYGIE